MHSFALVYVQARTLHVFCAYVREFTLNCVCFRACVCPGVCVRACVCPGVCVRAGVVGVHACSRPCAVWVRERVSVCVFPQVRNSF